MTTLMLQVSNLARAAANTPMISTRSHGAFRMLQSLLSVAYVQAQ